MLLKIAAANPQKGSVDKLSFQHALRLQVLASGGFSASHVGHRVHVVIFQVSG